MDNKKTVKQEILFKDVNGFFRKKPYTLGTKIIGVFYLLAAIGAFVLGINSIVSPRSVESIGIIAIVFSISLAGLGIYTLVNKGIQLKGFNITDNQLQKCVMKFRDKTVSADSEGEMNILSDWRIDSLDIVFTFVKSKFSFRGFYIRSIDFASKSKRIDSIVYEEENDDYVGNVFLILSNSNQFFPGYFQPNDEMLNCLNNCQQVIKKYKRDADKWCTLQILPKGHIVKPGGMTVMFGILGSPFQAAWDLTRQQQLKELFYEGKEENHQFITSFHHFLKTNNWVLEM